MKYLLSLLLCCGVLVSCSTYQNQSAQNTSQSEEDVVRIANDSIEYEIIIIEPGFNNWLSGRVKPKGYYSQEFLESRNQLYVAEWNRRALHPTRYGAQLYQMQIDYNPQIDYGYDVNYKLYYYFIYFQITYKQQLTGFVPRL